MKRLSFSDCFIDKTGGNRKFKTTEYLSEGKLPIIDQGRKFIGGYTDNVEDKFKGDLPCIIYGDHSREVKYIDFDYALGADGVKVLQANKEILIPKFGYYYLQTVALPEAGYDRSFKYLKRIDIPVPDLQTQRQIVAALDKAKSLIDKRQKSIELLDELLKNTFLDTFQHLYNNQDDLVSLESLIVDGPQNGLYKHADYYGDGVRILRIDGFYNGVVTGLNDLKRLTLTEKEIEKYSLAENDIVINRVNSREYLGKSAIIPSLDEATVFESNMMRFNVNEDLVRPKFLIYALQQEFVKAQILKRAKDAINQSSINQQDVKSIKIPRCSLKEQNQFETLFEKTSEIRLQFEKSLLVAKELFQALLQRAFRGDLDLITTEVERLNMQQQFERLLEAEDAQAVGNNKVFISKLKRLLETKNSDDPEERLKEKTYTKIRNVLFELMKNEKIEQEYDKVDKEIKLDW